MKKVRLPDFMWAELLSILAAKAAVEDSHGPKLYDEIAYEIEQQTGLEKR